jgi:hypothetical protein
MAATAEALALLFTATCGQLEPESKRRMGTVNKFM